MTTYTCTLCGGSNPAPAPFQLVSGFPVDRTPTRPVCNTCGRHNADCRSTRRVELLTAVLSIASELQNSPEVGMDDIAHSLETAAKIAVEIFDGESC